MKSEVRREAACWGRCVLGPPAAVGPAGGSSCVRWLHVAALVVAAFLGGCNPSVPGTGVPGGVRAAGQDRASGSRIGEPVENPGDGPAPRVAFCAYEPDVGDEKVGCPEMEEVSRQWSAGELLPEAVFEAAYSVRGDDSCRSMGLELMYRLRPELFGREHAELLVAIAFVELKYEARYEPDVLDTALQGVEESEAIGDPCLASRAWRRVAYYYFETHQPERAGEAVGAAADWVEGCDDRKEQGRVLRNLAEWYRQTEDQLGQFEALKQALETAEPGSREYLLYLAQIAELRVDLGDVADEGDRLARLLEQAEDGGEVDLAFELTMHLAGVYRDLGRHGDAMELLTSACALAQGTPHSGEKSSLVNLVRAWVLLGMDRVDDAHVILARLPVDCFDRSVPRYSHLRWLIEAELKFREGRFDEAVGWFERVLDDGLAEPEPKWRAMYGLARVARGRGDMGVARHWLWEAVKAIEVQREKTASAFWSLAYLSQREGLYRMWLETLLEAWQAGTEAGQGEAGRGPSVGAAGDDREAASSGDVGDLDGRQLQKAFVDGVPSSDDLLVAVERVMSQAFVADLFRDRGGVPGIAGDPDTRAAWMKIAGSWPTGKALRETLPADVPVLVYLPLEDSLLLLEVTRARVDVHRIEQPRQAWLWLVDKLDSSIRNDRILPPDQLEGIGGILLSSVIDDLPGDGSPVGFILGGVLEVLPVAALRVGGRYVVEICAPFELPNLRSATWLDRHEPPRGGARVLAVAYGKDLEYPRKEADLLVRSGFRVTLLAGSGATVANVRSGLGTPELIHFATHSKGPRRITRGAPPAIRTDEAEMELYDGVITVSDIQKQKLNAGLVVLSGCETRVGRAGMQEQGYGALSRAVLVAGADAVMASRWRVGDETTYALMAEFYARYPDLGRAVALAQAQRAMIASSRVTSTMLRGDARPLVIFRQFAGREKRRIPYADPWSWAAFTMVGRWD